jgi:glycosidase
MILQNQFQPIVLGYQIFCPQQVSVFRGSAWEYNDERQQFYLHQFLASQPDLNYRNPAVLQAMKDVIAFWLDLGVDGFRQVHF